MDNCCEELAGRLGAAGGGQTCQNVVGWWGLFEAGVRPTLRVDCQEQWADGCVGLGGRGWQQDQCLERAPAGGLGGEGEGRYQQDINEICVCLYLVYIINQICTDIDVHIRLYFSADINEICVCLYLVYIINQICTDISVYICSYTSISLCRYKQI
jgi:hypothetical protein